MHAALHCAIVMLVLWGSIAAWTGCMVLVGDHASE
jgi:hypothetical protein